MRRTPWKRGRLVDGRRRTRGFSGTRADLGGYGNIRNKSGVRWRQNLPGARTAIGGGNGGRNKSEEPPRTSRKAVNPYTRPVCAEIEQNRRK